MFNSTGPHYCPHCPPTLNAKGRRIDVALVQYCENYSGCGVDFARCPTCGKHWQISYKVDKIIEKENHQSYENNKSSRRKSGGVS